MNSITPLSWKLSKPAVSRSAFFPFALESELSRVMNDFFGSESPVSSSNGSFAPAINVQETKEQYLVTAEVPGVSEKEIEISLNDGLLKVSGEKKEDFDRTEGKTHYTGRRYGSFSQQVYLSSPIDEDKIDASVKDGILTIVLPKSVKEQDKVKKVSVRSAK